MFTGTGYLIKGVGGLYTVRLFPTAPDAAAQPLDGRTVSARGRGSLRRGGELLIGDLVEIVYDTTSYTESPDGDAVPDPDGTGVAISRILPRRTSLIRPPMANLDVLFAVVSVTAPEPDPETVDKLLCIAVHNRIQPVVVINKRDLDAAGSDRLAAIYRTAGFPVFMTDGIGGEGVEELIGYIRRNLPGKIAAFAGASGVGKSTLLGRIFPSVRFETGDISRRIARGKNTTRHVELHPLPAAWGEGYLADTPGFTMLDFEQFDFFSLDDLPLTFPEFLPRLGSCRYTDCSHTRESAADCAVVAAVRAGEIPESRHRTYCTLYEILKKKPRWKAEKDLSH